MRKYRKRCSILTPGRNDYRFNPISTTITTRNMGINANNDSICLKSTCIPLRRSSFSTSDYNSLTQSLAVPTHGGHVSDAGSVPGLDNESSRGVKRMYSESIGIRTSAPLVSESSVIPSVNKTKAGDTKRSGASSMVHRHALSRPSHRKLTAHSATNCTNSNPYDDEYYTRHVTIGNSLNFGDLADDHSATDPYIDVLASLSNDVIKLGLYGLNQNDYKFITNNGLVDKRRMSRRSSDVTVVDDKSSFLDASPAQMLPSDKEPDSAKSQNITAGKDGSQYNNKPHEDNPDENPISYGNKVTPDDEKVLCDDNGVSADLTKLNYESLCSTLSKSIESNIMPKVISNDMLLSIAELLMPYCTDKNADDIVNALSQAKKNYEKHKKITSAKDIPLVTANDNSLDKNAPDNKVLFDFFKKKSVPRNRLSPYSSQNSDNIFKRVKDVNCLNYSQNASVVSPLTTAQQHTSAPGSLSRVARMKSIGQHNLSIKSLRLKYKRSAFSTSSAQGVSGVDSKKLETQLWSSLGTVTILIGRALGQGSFAKVFPARLSLSSTSNDSGIDIPNSSASNSRVGNEAVDPFQLCFQCINRGYLECALKRLTASSTNRRMQYIREREMMRHLNPHVMRPLACRFFSNGSKSFQILMPRARGDLASMLKSLYSFRANQLFLYYTQMRREDRLVSYEEFRVGLTEKEIKFLILQILSGYAFLQTTFQGNMVRHSDIKLANVLVFCSQFDRYNPLKWNIKLADFGSSLLLHPTQHFSENESILQLTNALITEWVGESSNQIQSLVQGTIRFNAPEALTHDRHGSHRSNHNQNLIRAHESLYGPLDKVISEYNQTPRVWGVVEKVDTDGRYPISTPFVPGADMHDIAEYSLVDSRADMWSIGVLLAELIRGSSSENSLPKIIPTCLTESEFGSNCRNSLNRKAKRLGDLLGTGLFTVRDGMTDKEVNKMMALEISNCNGTKSDTEAYIRSLYNECDMPHLDVNFWDLFLSFFVYKPHKRVVAADALGHKWFCSSGCPMYKSQGNACANDRNLLHFDLVDSLQCYSNHNLLEHSIINSNSSDIGSGHKDIKCNAWFSGAWLYHTLVHSGQYDPSSPLHQLYRKEAGILESREKVFWGKTGAVLSLLIKLKDSRICDMTSTLASHILGHALSQYKKGL